MTDRHKGLIIIFTACVFLGIAVGVGAAYVFRSMQEPMTVENDYNDNQIPDDGESMSDGDAEEGSLIDESDSGSARSSSSTTAYTGSECESTLATYCAPLQTRDWMTWCTSQIEAWRAVGVEAINPCANSKYAKDSCVEAMIFGGEDVPQECRNYHTALNTSSADVQEQCLYTTRPGGVCEGVMPAPVAPGTKPEDVVVPFDDCLRDNYEVLTAECQAAYDLHVAVSKSTTR